MAPDLFILTPKEWSQPTLIPNALDFPQTKVPPSHGNKEKRESLPSLFLVLGQPQKLSLSLRPWVIRGLRLPSHLSCPLCASPGHAWVWALCLGREQEPEEAPSTPGAATNLLPSSA